MLICFWDMFGVVHREYLPKNATITADYYCEVLKRLQLAIKEKRPWLLEEGGKVCLQHDNARPHTAKKTTDLLQTLGWDVLPHPPYSPDLAPSDYHLFRPLAAKLKNMVFQDEAKVCEFVDNFLEEKENEGDFYHKGIEKLPELWKGCIEARGKYFYKM